MRRADLSSTQEQRAIHRAKRNPMKRTIVALGVVMLPTLGCSAQVGGPADETTGSAEPSHTLLYRGPVDSPLKSHQPTPDVETATTLEYFGGPVISNPKVYVVWWGSPTKINPVLTKTKGGIADFFAGVTNSSFFDWFNEYDTNIKANAGSHKGLAGTNQLIGRGNYAGTLTLSAIPTGNVTDAQIQTTLEKAFAAKTLPAPDANTIYAIYFPSSVSIDIGGGGGLSCQSFGAYHMNTTAKTAGSEAYYLVMPDCGYAFADWTSVTAHELVEALTDPIPTPGSNPNYPQAWNDSGGNESGDLCESQPNGTVKTGLGTFTVQTIWDEASQSCKAFRSYAEDYNVSFAKTATSLTIGTAATVTIDTATVAGKAQPLTLSVVAPTGVKATLSSTKITSGQTATP
jgi:hypothetical protein